MVSIKDVAEKAGVAISTVSKVLNNYPNITDATREKVNRAIDELNYVPNSIAAALSSKHSGKIALLLDPGRLSPAAAEITVGYLQGALDTGKELNQEILTVFFSSLAGMGSDEIIRYLKARGVLSIIVFGLTQEERTLRSLIQEEEFFTVATNVPFISKSITSIGIDQEQAQYDVAKRVMAKASGSAGIQKNILYIAGKGSAYVTAERTKGMKRAAEEMGASLSIRYGDFSEERAKSIALITGRDKDITICASDLMAIGALKAYETLKLDMPVSGFDGLSLLKYAGDGIPTIRQDFYDIAATAVKEARRLMDGEEGRQVVMPYEVVDA